MLERIPKGLAEEAPISYDVVGGGLIKESKLPVVIDFSASWCGPCQKVYPLLVRLAEAFPEVNFFKVDVSKDDEDVGEIYEVSSLPTIIFFHNGEQIAREEGVQEGAKNILNSFADLLVQCGRCTSQDDADKAILDALTDKPDETVSRGQSN